MVAWAKPLSLRLPWSPARSIRALIWRFVASLGYAKEYDSTGEPA